MTKERIEHAVSAQAAALARRTAESGDDVAAAAEVFLIEALRGARGMESVKLSLIQHAAESFVRSALEEGLDPGAAAEGLVQGAASWSREQGMPVAGTAIALAEQGAIDAAERAGPEAGRKVREALR